MESGNKFSRAYGHVKLLFYSSFNTPYRRSKSSHSELVSVELMKSFCLSVTLYGLEVIEPQRSALAMMNNLGLSVKFSKCLIMMLSTTSDIFLDYMILR